MLRDDTVYLTFDHKAIAKARPRFGIDRVYDSQKDQGKLVKQSALYQLKAQGFREIKKGAVTVEMTIIKKDPKLKKEEFGTFVTTRPDIDNYVKFYLDVMNKLVYEDDAQVVEIQASKIHGKKNQVTIVIRDK